MNPILALLNGMEVVAILAIVLVLFGAKKLPELAKGLGQGIKEFKKSSREIQDELDSALDVNSPPPPPRREIPPAQSPIIDASATTATPAPTETPKH